MFYSTQILSKKGPLGVIWIAAHLDRRLKRQQINDTSIPSTVESIINPEAPLALRLSGQLLLGVVRIYSRKVGYLFQDVNDILSKIQQAFREHGTVVDLPEDGLTAPVHAITLPDNYDDISEWFTTGTGLTLEPLEHLSALGGPGGSLHLSLQGASVGLGGGAGGGGRDSLSLTLVEEWSGAFGSQHPLDDEQFEVAGDELERRLSLSGGPVEQLRAETVRGPDAAAGLLAGAFPGTPIQDTGLAPMDEDFGLFEQAPDPASTALGSQLAALDTPASAKLPPPPPPAAVTASAGGGGADGDGDGGGAGSRRGSLMLDPVMPPDLSELLPDVIPGDAAGGLGGLELEGLMEGPALSAGRPSTTIDSAGGPAATFSTSGGAPTVSGLHMSGAAGQGEAGRQLQQEGQQEDLHHFGLSGMRHEEREEEAATEAAAAAAAEEQRQAFGAQLRLAQRKRRVKLDLTPDGAPNTELPAAAIRELLKDRAPLLTIRGRNAAKRLRGDGGAAPSVSLARDPFNVDAQLGLRASCGGPSGAADPLADRPASADVMNPRLLRLLVRGVGVGAAAATVPPRAAAGDGAGGGGGAGAPSSSHRTPRRGWLHGEGEDDVTMTMPMMGDDGDYAPSSGRPSVAAEPAGEEAGAPWMVDGEGNEPPPMPMDNEGCLPPLIGAGALEDPEQDLEQDLEQQPEGGPWAGSPRASRGYGGPPSALARRSVGGTSSEALRSEPEGRTEQEEERAAAATAEAAAGAWGGGDGDSAQQPDERQRQEDARLGFTARTRAALLNVQARLAALPSPSSSTGDGEEGDERVRHEPGGLRRRRRLPVSSMLGDADRSGAARLFFEMLVLKTKGYVDLQQAAPYEELHVLSLTQAPLLLPAGEAGHLPGTSA